MGRTIIQNKGCKIDCLEHHILIGSYRNIRRNNVITVLGEADHILKIVAESGAAAQITARFHRATGAREFIDYFQARFHDKPSATMVIGQAMSVNPSAGGFPEVISVAQLIPDRKTDPIGCSRTCSSKKVYVRNI